MTHHDYTEEQLQTLIASCHSREELLNKLAMKKMTRSLQRRIKNSKLSCDNLNIYFNGLHSKFNKFTRDLIL